ncbi:hypothetical protein ACOMHN_038592 [Nucella lapillus]
MKAILELLKDPDSPVQGEEFSCDVEEFTNGSVIARYTTRFKNNNSSGTSLMKKAAAYLATLHFSRDCYGFSYKHFCSCEFSCQQFSCDCYHFSYQHFCGD